VSDVAPAVLPEVGPLAAEVVAALTRAGSTVAVAESLTGGAVTDALVSVPGASRCLRGGVVAYATDLKTTLLGVPVGLVEEHGAVHAEVALAMARGVRDRLGATYGLATTGVAGPDPQDGRAPGTYHVAVVGPDDHEVVSPPPRPGTRDEVRRAATESALRLLARLLARTVDRTADR
jgi:nicotinamide-nucleotide amidase